MINSLRDLFHHPEIRTIGGTGFVVYKIAFEQFDDALLIGQYVISISDGAAGPIQMLRALAAGTPERAALERLLAGCLALPARDGAAPQRLQPEDIRAMPAVTVGLAIAEVLEVNADFFLRSLPPLAASISRIMSIGGASPSNSSALATGPSTSPATASPSSRAT
ncbi:MAG: hypothetical protein LBE78_12905 [Burkholderiaceae bacterium]|jgi:hypothetical protein|nr:hypothetical protein [Burkholderiaceae bacterium]